MSWWRWAGGALCVAGLGLAASGVAAQPAVQYSRIDRATVRVFAVTGIGVERVPSVGGWARPLAVPAGGHGSGVLVSADGVVLTAQHVIANARLLAVSVPGHPHAYPARVVYTDAERDIAILVVDGTFDAFVAMPETPRTLRIRETVDAIGYPLDPRRLDPQSSRGIVAGVLPDGRLQLSIAVNEGNSGGPLVDENEALLGIVVARGAPELGVEGVGVAVPIAQVIPPWRATVGEGDRHRRLREEIGRERAREHASAQLTSTLVRVGGVGMVREAIDLLARHRRGELREVLERMRLRDASADTIVLAAAYDWDIAQVILERGGGATWPRELRDPAMGATADRYMRRAIRRCQEAARRDPGIAVRSPFVAMMLQTVAPRLAGGAASATLRPAGHAATGNGWAAAPGGAAPISPVSSERAPWFHTQLMVGSTSSSRDDVLTFGAAIIADIPARARASAVTGAFMLGLEWYSLVGEGSFAGGEVGAMLAVGGERTYVRFELYWGPAATTDVVSMSGAGARILLAVGSLSIGGSVRVVSFDDDSIPILGGNLGFNY